MIFFLLSCPFFVCHALFGELDVFIMGFWFVWNAQCLRSMRMNQRGLAARVIVFNYIVFQSRVSPPSPTILIYTNWWFRTDQWLMNLLGSTLCVITIILSIRLLWTNGVCLFFVSSMIENSRKFFKWLSFTIKSISGKCEEYVVKEENPHNIKKV